MELFEDGVTSCTCGEMLIDGCSQKFCTRCKKSFADRQYHCSCGERYFLSQGQKGCPFCGTAIVYPVKDSDS